MLPCMNLVNILQNLVMCLNAVAQAGEMFPSLNILLLTVVSKFCLLSARFSIHLVIHVQKTAAPLKTGTGRKDPPEEKLYLDYISVLWVTESAQGARFELEQNPKHRTRGEMFVSRSRSQPLKATPDMKAMPKDCIAAERAEQVGWNRANSLKVGKYTVTEGHLCFLHCCGINYESHQYIHPLLLP